MKTHNTTLKKHYPKAAPKSDLCAFYSVLVISGHLNSWAVGLYVALSSTSSAPHILVPPSLRRPHHPEGAILSGSHLPWTVDVGVYIVSVGITLFVVSCALGADRVHICTISHNTVRFHWAHAT